ncbi:MAG: hypothetical protein ACJAZP_003808 [Psychromonas sp.]|jgi:hypothetical protein
MATYSVHLFCDECSQVHPMGIQLALDDGPAEKASIGDVYNGKEIDPLIVSMQDNWITCPVTGKLTMQKDNDQVFLVPIGN